MFSQPLEAVVSWKKELLWSLLAVWQSTSGSAQIESELGSCLQGLVVISVCCAATLCFQWDREEGRWWEERNTLVLVGRAPNFWC